MRADWDNITDDTDDVGELHIMFASEEHRLPDYYINECLCNLAGSNRIGVCSVLIPVTMEISWGREAYLIENWQY